MERALLERIVRETGVAQKHGETVFLCDPHWSAAQQLRFKEIIEAEHRRQANEPTANKKSLRLAIPTGGSSGGLKFALHDERTLGAAVRGFCAHFGVSRVNAVDCLPPWHVSGLMARLRCAATGGVHVPWEWKRLEAGELPKLPQVAGKSGGSASVSGGAGGWFLSLVPTQLQRLLRQGERACEGRRWLCGFHAVFIGGGPLWPSLADEAAAARLPIILSYGMTETGAMVAAQRLGDFAAGDRSSGVPMPHAQISINGDGLVCVRGESVMRGALSASYLASRLTTCIGRHRPPSRRQLSSQTEAARRVTDERGAEREFTTADLGRIDDAGRLHILGRRDEVAISGGEKVRLAEVEAALRSQIGQAAFDDVAVVAVPDAEWGEAVIACYSNQGTTPLSKSVIEATTRGLARHQRPKRWLAFSPEDWPRNAQGKLNRAALREAVLARRAELR